jgi:hypothetical protein
VVAEASRSPAAGRADACARLPGREARSLGLGLGSGTPIPDPKPPLPPRVHHAPRAGGSANVRACPRAIVARRIFILMPQSARRLLECPSGQPTTIRTFDAAAKIPSPPLVERRRRAASPSPATVYSAKDVPETKATRGTEAGRDKARLGLDSGAVTSRSHIRRGRPAPSARDSRLATSRERPLQTRRYAGSIRWVAGSHRRDQWRTGVLQPKRSTRISPR